jgi:hypothetical protein
VIAIALSIAAGMLWQPGAETALKEANHD